jgi:ATP-dependent DNA helicase RecG
MLLLDRKAFEEQTIREAVNNAVIHRDYTVSESSFVMQYQTCIEIRSPGGFPEGVTIENIIDESRPRNKLIADVLYVCELVEQFGNGVNLMFAKQLSLGKQPPDYNSSDDLHVMLRLDGNIQDVEFAKYVLAVAEKEHKDLNAQELLIAHKIKDGRPIAPNETVANLLKLGLIEQVGRRRFMLSKQYYSDMHRPAQYTRQKGLSRNKNKELILQHIHDFGGGKKNDFRGIFNPVLTDNQITVLIRELKNEGYIFLEGRTTSPLSSWKLTDEGERKVSEKKV